MAAAAKGVFRSTPTSGLDCESATGNGVLPSGMPRGIDGLEVDLLAQEVGYLRDREPVYAQLLPLLHRLLAGDFGARLAAAWANREVHAVYERPLMLLAALRYDALSDPDAHPLQAALAEYPPRVDAVSEPAVTAAVAPERTRFWQVVRERAVQTNETTRAVTWLWPAALLASAGERRAIALVDIGTSAGLNLTADGLPPLWHDAAGAPIAVAPRPELALRIGFDIAPLDVREPDAARWLRACVWPSDTQRLARLEQSIACFTAAATGAAAPRLVACTLPEVPVRLDALPGESLIVCMQSIVRDYLPAAERNLYEAEMRALLLRRPARATLWAELEMDPERATSQENSATLRVRYAAEPDALRELTLARTHPHPKRLFVDAAAVAVLQRDFAAS